MVTVPEIVTVSVVSSPRVTAPEKVAAPPMKIMSASDRRHVRCLVAETKRARVRRRSVQRGGPRDNHRADNRNRAIDGDQRKGAHTLIDLEAHVRRDTHTVDRLRLEFD